MDDTRLTKDADALLCVLYREYLNRRASGKSKADARFFSGSDYIHKELMPKWSIEDVDETCRELSRAGMLKCLFADNVTYLANLTDLAIIHQEYRFQDNVSELFQYLEKLRALLPW